MIERRRWLYFIGGAIFAVGLILGHHAYAQVIALIGAGLMLLSVPLGIWSQRRKQRASLEAAQATQHVPSNDQSTR
jgi:ABC-type proline/glycine betaine transport system permease subunit